MENPNEMGQAENTENVKSSITNKFLDQSMDSDELSGSSVEGGKHLATPAIQRLHKTLKEFNIHSPTDAIMSPCSQKLANQARVRKGHQTHNEIQKQDAQKAKYGNVKERTGIDFNHEEEEEDIEQQHK